jgi:hypothetical protein
MTEDKDPPIEPQEYIAGVKVVDIGDLRVARGLSRRPHSSCEHKTMVYDQNERRIWCEDCEKNVEAFDAFVSLVEWHSKAANRIKERLNRVAEAEKNTVRSLAAKAMDEVWRSRNMVPACPHCGQGLFPENFKHGCSSLSREYAEQIAKFRKKK